VARYEVRRAVLPPVSSRRRMAAPAGLNLAHRIGSTCLLEGASLDVGRCLLWVISRHLQRNTRLLSVPGWPSVQLD